MPQDEHFRVNLIWHLTRLAIYARNLLFDLAYQVLDLFSRHIIFILDCFLLEGHQVQDSVALLHDHVLTKLKPLKLHLRLLCSCQHCLVNSCLRCAGCLTSDPSCLLSDIGLVLADLLQYVAKVWRELLSDNLLLL